MFINKELLYWKKVSRVEQLSCYSFKKSVVVIVSKVVDLRGIIQCLCEISFKQYSVK